jgi:hypothetical protein
MDTFVFVLLWLLLMPLGVSMTHPASPRALAPGAVRPAIFIPSSAFRVPRLIPPPARNSECGARSCNRERPRYFFSRAQNGLAQIDKLNANFACKNQA